jgi:hypothetical protein
MDSMIRPSRGLLESATTTRYDGCFFLPTRINLILTMPLLYFFLDVGKLPSELIGSNDLSRAM